MAKDESPQDIISAYRKKQQRANRTPTLVFVAAGLLLVVGAGLLIFWLTGAGMPDISLAGIFASKTPTPSVTPTPTEVPPTATLTETPTVEPPTNTPEPSLTPTRSGAVIYVVEDGDTLYGIAEKFEMDYLVLVEANRERLGLDPANPIIKVGDELLIPPPGTELPTATPLPDYLPPGSRVEYTVQPGDNLGLIAEKFNSTVDDIIERNDELAENPNDLYVGQVLVVRVNLVTPAPTAAEGEDTTPEVTPGSVSTLTPTP
ncbi:MAG: LysM peptidoglycan-binding domain-containing protein [Anaerolineae bacterium]|nr:LysM peptidoglycan-binding domain-containing protein [Anaerolineae bacterium]MBL6965127.1 LysM peptidoglycan-binding domain-containing protein [Anaerolineales bacterium]